MLGPDFFFNNSINIEENPNLIDDLFDYSKDLNIYNELPNNNENYFNDNNFNNFNFIPFPQEQPKSINKTIIIKSVGKNTLLGRKRKDSAIKGKHTKYNLDNQVRKVKVLFKNALLEFINNKMKNLKLTVEINGEFYIVKELLNIRPKLIEDINIKSNMTLFDTQIKDILSDDISGAYKNYPKNYNKIVIDKILENPNNQILINILNMTFLECLKYYRKDEEIINDDNYACLKGLEKKYENLSDILKKGFNTYDKEYEDGIFSLIENFETIYSEKTPRTKKNKIKN